MGTKWEERILNIPVSEGGENTPLWINALKKSLKETSAMSGVNEANHVLINEYNAPAGIDPHFDGIVYNPHVVILTTTGRALMDFWPKEEESANEKEGEEEPVAQVLLQPRSRCQRNNDTNGAISSAAYATRTMLQGHPPSVAKIIENGEENVANLNRSALRHSVVFVKKNIAY